MLFERLQSVPGVDSFRAERSPSLAAEPVRLVR
jgi:hypothetical protein